ncbi:DUF4373 domain-containing protein [Bacteroides sp. GD17]|jgi:hypothetical protein|uniref:DUF4373 domain-containing protein n=1 Tax=Bacteroides sp. GD17 TaxID=3139826 RepID=UPI0025FCDC9B|nr:DUF4373 domain-containing protein [uncultured Bacteroides sp.]
MSRIKKRGLDYFPLNTDFMHDRLVRRIMKREGDGAFAILLGALSCIYADEGYYVRADELFYEDLSACLYEKSAADVKRILALAVEYGIFNAALFGEYGILTSAEIQRQYLFSTKRRKSSVIEARYCLVDDSQADEDATTEPGNAAIKPENAASGTHSTSQHNTSQHSKAYPLLDSSPETGGTEGTAVPSAEEEYLRKIESLQPPQDGTNRNFDGLLSNLQQFRIPAPEQYAIILKSNFGAIGHPMWKGFYALRESHGKIRQPGRYLLSLCNK